MTWAWWATAIFAMALALPAGSAAAQQLRPTQISVGAGHACARMSDGTARCWGESSHGELGDGTREARTDPVVVAGLSDVAEISAGDGYTCARLEDGSVRCWGSNVYGQLGDGTTSEVGLAPVTVRGVAGARAIDTADGYACAIVASGAVRCWGRNDYRQLGDGSDREQRAAVAVRGLRSVASIAAWDFACAARAGRAHCWGSNHAPLAQPIAGSSDVAEIATAGLFACARGTDGGVRCWGWDDSGQLGRGQAHDDWEGIDEWRSTPTLVRDVSGATAIAAGRAHACVVGGDGSVRCWGASWANPDFGRCLRRTRHRGAGGSPLQWEFCPVATRVRGVRGATHIAAGGDQTCVLTNDGRVLCWGRQPLRAVPLPR